MSISGVVSTVYVHTNDQVIGGELLLKLDQTKYLSDIEVASASVDQAQAAVDNATLAVEQLPADATTDQIAAAQAALETRPDEPGAGPFQQSRGPGRAAPDGAARTDRRHGREHRRRRRASRSTPARRSPRSAT